MLQDYKYEYCIKFLKAKAIQAKDICNETNIPLSTVYYLQRNPQKVYKSSKLIVDNLYLFFKSLSLDENKLDSLKRVEHVTYEQ